MWATMHLLQHSPVYEQGSFTQEFQVTAHLKGVTVQITEYSETLDKVFKAKAQLLIQSCC